MTYTAPTTRVADEYIDETIWDSEVVENIKLLYAASAFVGIVAKTANYTVVQTDTGYLITVDATSGAITVTLPQISGILLPFNVAVIKIDSSANAVTVARGGSDTINGATSISLATQYANARLTGSGTAWYALGIVASTTVASISTSGSAQGDIIQRGASAWGVLAIGTAGQVPTVNAGATALAYANVISVVAVQVFTSSGTYTPRAGIVYAIIECVGPGGGGGGVTGDGTHTLGGGGGGAGGYSRKVVSAATIGASQAVTVGSGGNGGAAGSNAGSNGSSATSVGTLCIANAGSGGQFASSATNPVGGAGGTAGTGDLAATGGRGNYGLYSGGTLNVQLAGGYGGASIFGGGGAGGVSSAGGNATVYGAGGGGGSVYNAASKTPGGNGSAGVVIITEFATK